MDDKKTSTKKTTQNWGTTLLYTIGSILLLILAVIVFVFIPGVTSATKQQELIVGKWNKKPIKYVANSDFARNVKFYSDYYEQMGYKMSDQMYPFILGQAFNATVFNMAIIDEVEKSGFIPAQSAVNRILKNGFLDSDGNFSMKIFNETPNSTKIAYMEDIVKNLKYSTYLYDLFSQEIESERNIGLKEVKVPYYGLKKTTNEVDAIARMDALKKGFDYVIFPTDNYPKELALDFAKENPDLFTQYNFSVISLESESEAKSVLKQLERNEITFFDAVENFSTKNYSGTDGTFYYTYQYQIKPLLASEDDLNAVLATEVDAYSPIVKTSNTYSIFKANSEPKKADFTSEAFADTALSYLQQYEMGRVQDYFLSIANDFALNASLNGFEIAASKYDLEVAELVPFPLNYGNSKMLTPVPTSSNPAFYGADQNETFLKTAFALHEKEVSVPIVLGSNIVVLQCTEVSNIIDDAHDYASLYSDNEKAFDNQSMSNYFLSSDKLENNVDAVYQKLMRNSSN